MRIIQGIRAGIGAMLAGLAVSIGSLCIAVGIVLTVPIVVIAAFLYPDGRQVKQWVSDWIDGFRMP